MNNSQRLRLTTAMIALAGVSPFYSRGGGDDPTRKERPCLNCGKPKTHNNAFCSPECAREHKSKKP